MAVQAPPVPAPPARPARPGGWVGALSSTDHKRIGVNLIFCSLAFFLIGGVYALLMRAGKR